MANILDFDGMYDIYKSYNDRPLSNKNDLEMFFNAGVAFGIDNVKVNGSKSVEVFNRIGQKVNEFNKIKNAASYYGMRRLAVENSIKFDRFTRKHGLKFKLKK